MIPSLLLYLYPFCPCFSYVSIYQSITLIIFENCSGRRKKGWSYVFYNRFFIHIKNILLQLAT